MLEGDKQLRRELAANPYDPESIEHVYYRTECFHRCTARFQHRTEITQRWVLIPLLVAMAAEPFVYELFFRR